MKNQGSPMATLMAFSTLAIIGASAKHCIKKYSHSGSGGGRRIVLKFPKKHSWKVL